MIIPPFTATHSRWPTLRLLLVVLTALTTSACFPTGKAPEQTIEVARQAIYSGQFSQDGQWLLVGSYYHGGNLWSTSPVNRHFDWNHQTDGTTGIIGSAFSADGRYAATNDNRTIVLWDMKSGEAKGFWTAPGVIESMQLTSDGRYAMLGLEDNSATLFDIQNGGIRARYPHSDIVYSVAMSRDALQLVTGCADGLVQVWKSGQTDPLIKVQQDNPVRTVAMTRDGRLIFASALGKPGRIMEAGSGRVIAELPPLRGYYTAARFSDNGDQLLTGSSSGQVQLWETNSGTVVAEWYSKGFSLFANTRTQVEDVAFARDGGVLAITSNGQLHFMKR